MKKNSCDVDLIHLEDVKTCQKEYDDGTKIVGDRRDILPGLRGNIAGGCVQAVFAELGDGCGNELAFGLFTFGCHRSRRHRTIKN